MSNELTIAEMNQVIAVFDGWERYEDTYGVWFKREGLIKCLHPKLQELKYHTSWDALMPVIDKIESLFEGNAFTVEIKGNWCLISQNTQHWMAYGDKINLESIQCKCETKLDAVYKAVYKFITWYNQYQQTTTNG